MQGPADAERPGLAIFNEVIADPKRETSDPGWLDLDLAWETDADLDFAVTGPRGDPAVQAFSTANPEAHPGCRTVGRSGHSDPVVHRRGPGLSGAWLVRVRLAGGNARLTYLTLHGPAAILS